MIKAASASPVSRPRTARKGEIVLRAVHPNVGIEADLRRRLDALIEDMNRSVLYWIKAAYRANEPVMAQDATPANDLKRAVRALVRRWEDNFDEAAPKLAAWFLQDVRTRSDATLKRILRDGGFSVKFQMTPAMRDVIDASVNSSVALIKTIPQRYLSQVETMVMESVQTGRDLATLTDRIHGQYGVTRRRAALIARDQNNKATSAMQRARQDELGITEAIWQHSGGGREPRPKHVKASGTRYDIKRGLPIGDKGQLVFPGEEINCRCVSRSIVKGFS